MKISFKKHHLLLILEKFFEKKIPLDLFLRNYFRKNKAVGSKDRKYICENVYKLIRWKSLIDYIYASNTLSEKIDLLEDFNPLKYLDDSSIPEHIRVSFPNNYFETLRKYFTKTQILKFCLTSNEVAPTTIRTNLLKTTRDDLFEKLKNRFDISKTKKSSFGIVFHKKINFFELDEFKKGLFEIQDEASQLVADLVDAKEKYHILDYCAGAGGKTLAFAHKMKNSGQIYLHDVRDLPLIEAKKRLKRASIQNFQIKTSNDLNKLNKKMDLLVLDVPCSGSGTLRRNPDMKWKFEEEDLKNLIQLQKNIFEKSIKYLKTNGKIIYITCSIFPDENENQIDYFIKKYNLKIVKSFFSFPISSSFDGFFGCVLKKA